MIVVIIILLVFSFAGPVKSQIDSIALKKEIHSLSSISDHIRFWQSVYDSDQDHRGTQANDSIDFSNLLKCTYYVNTFGYPSRKNLGQVSQIINLVWIHNRYPQVDLISFPIIHEGYVTRNISEDEFRNYYIRSIYRRKYPDDGYATLPMNKLLRKVAPGNSLPINTKKLITSYEKERNFLKAPNVLIGTWSAPIQIDTLNLEGHPIYIDKTMTPIKIFKSDKGKYYYHQLHSDGSHYPQELIYNKEDETFNLLVDTTTYYKIMHTGALKVGVGKDKHEIYTPHQR